VIPSRHLGLQTADEFPGGPGFIDTLAEAAEASIDLDRLVGLAGLPSLPEPRPAPFSTKAVSRVAWARDPAFCFYYEDNLDHLREAGGEVVAFSPLAAQSLPEGADVLYLGGGYPEIFAERLAANDAMRRSIRRFHADGGTILAECGGLMACSRELVDVSGRSFPMWDLIPARVTMRPRFSALGYVTVVNDEATPFGPPGTMIRGHEFHYSTLEPLSRLDYVTRLHRPDAEPKPDGIRVGGLLAGYAHVHFGSNPEAARRLLGLEGLGRDLRESVDDGSIRVDPSTDLG
jgi:cobyrinic acid a,c-diamide synthase